MLSDDLLKQTLHGLFPRERMRIATITDLLLYY